MSDQNSHYGLSYRAWRTFYRAFCVLVYVF